VPRTSRKLWSRFNAGNDGLAVSAAATAVLNPVASLETDLGSDLGDYTVQRLIFTTFGENEGTSANDVGLFIVGALVVDESQATPSVDENLDWLYYGVFYHGNDTYPMLPERVDNRSARRVRAVDEEFQLVVKNKSAKNMILHLAGRVMISR